MDVVAAVVAVAVVVALQFDQSIRKKNEEKSFNQLHELTGVAAGCPQTGTGVPEQNKGIKNSLI